MDISLTADVIKIRFPFPNPFLFEIYVICTIDNNIQQGVGANECIVQLLKIHTPNIPVVLQCCRGVSGLAKNATNATKLGVLGVSDCLCLILKQHAFSTNLIEW